MCILKNILLTLNFLYFQKHIFDLVEMFYLMPLQILKHYQPQRGYLLQFEAELNAKFSPDRKYAVEQRSGANVKTYSEDYTKAYNKMLNGQVERRLKETIIDIGSLWFTAWTNAGMPNLERLETKQVTDSLKKSDENLDYLWTTGKPKTKEKGHED